jgi:hypothetical protein
LKKNGNREHKGICGATSNTTPAGAETRAMYTMGFDLLMKTYGKSKQCFDLQVSFFVGDGDSASIISIGEGQMQAFSESNSGLPTAAVLGDSNIRKVDDLAHLFKNAKGRVLAAGEVSLKARNKILKQRKTDKVKDGDELGKFSMYHVDLILAATADAINELRDFADELRAEAAKKNELILWDENIPGTYGGQYGEKLKLAEDKISHIVGHLNGLNHRLCHPEVCEIKQSLDLWKEDPGRGTENEADALKRFEQVYLDRKIQEREDVTAVVNETSEEKKNTSLYSFMKLKAEDVVLKQLEKEIKTILDPTKRLVSVLGRSRCSTSCLEAFFCRLGRYTEGM